MGKSLNEIEDIYKEIAKGHHERISLTILNLIIGGLIGTILGLFTVRFFRKKKNNEDQEPSRKKTRRFIVVLYLIFSSVFLVVHNTRTIYINISITYYSQLLVISSPFLTEPDRLSLASRFSQIQNRHDYDTIIAELINIIKSPGQKVPNK